MIWAFLSRFQDILSFIGFLWIMVTMGKLVWKVAHKWGDDNKRD